MLRLSPGVLLRSADGSTVVFVNVVGGKWPSVVPTAMLDLVAGGVTPCIVAAAVGKLAGIRCDHDEEEGEDCRDHDNGSWRQVEEGVG